MNALASILDLTGAERLPQSAAGVPVVVFDLDGTLVDTAPDLAASLNHCLTGDGLPPVDVDRLRPIAGRGARAMLLAGYEWAGRPISDEVLSRQTERFLAYYAAHVADHTRPYPGAVAALDRLAAHGTILAVCTNKTEALAKLLLRTLGLADRFAAICGADTFTERKPHPLHLAGTVARAGGRLGDAVMIGDTDTDMEAARRAGIPGVLALFGYDPDPAARGKAARMIAHFDDLTTALVARIPRPV